MVESARRDSPTSVAIDPADSELLAREISLTATQPDVGNRRRDYRTGALTVAIIALSVLLGWMVGRAGWNMAVQRAEIQSPNVTESLAAAEVSPDPLPASPSVEESINGAQPIPSLLPAVSPPRPAAKSKRPSAEPNGSLTIFERGKPVFRAEPFETKPQTEETGAAQLPRPATNGYLLTRVVPRYPESAKQQHIQGPVVLNALVGRDGAVQEVKVISGDPELVQAAVDAVKQWRFQPHFLKGNPVEFETQVTVNFSVP